MHILYSSTENQIVRIVGTFPTADMARTEVCRITGCKHSDWQVHKQIMYCMSLVDGLYFNVELSKSRRYIEEES